MMICRLDLKQRFEITDQALNNMTTWPEITVPTSDLDDELQVSINRTDFQITLDNFR